MEGLNVNINISHQDNLNFDKTAFLSDFLNNLNLRVTYSKGGGLNISFRDLFKIRSRYNNHGLSLNNI